MKKQTQKENKIEEILEYLKPLVINYRHPANKDVADVMQDMLDRFWEDFEPAVRKTISQTEERVRREERERTKLWTIEELEPIQKQIKTETDTEVKEYLIGQRNKLFDLQIFNSLNNNKE